MHASLHQKITIQSDKSEEFILYLSCLRDALSTLLNTKDGAAPVSTYEEI
jgi:dsDNA-binding SOS-regulon protein